MRRPALPDIRTWTRSALLVRLVVLLAGVVVILTPGQLKPILVLATALALALALISPSRAGAALVVLLGSCGWLAGYGLHGAPPVVPTLVFAVALYLLHSSTALAGAVPLASRLYPQAAMAWFRRWVRYLAVAGVLTAAGYGLNQIATAPVLQSIGLLAVVAVVAVAVALFARRSGADSR